MAGGAWTLAASLVVVGLGIVAGGGLPAPAAHSGAAPYAVAGVTIEPAHALPSAIANPLAGGQGRLFVNTTDPAVVPNHGIRTNLTAYYTLSLPADSAFQVAAEEIIGNDTAVFGFFQNGETYPVAFFSVFSNVTDATLHLAYWTSLILSTGASYDFALVVAGGTNWTLTVNGALFDSNASEATFDFGATQATWAGGVSFSEVSIYSTAPGTPSEVDVPLAIAVLTASGWYLPHEARTYSVLTGGAQWGVEGRLQDLQLAPGELVTGTTVSNVTNGTGLWNGGPVPVEVHLTVLGSVVAATGRVEAQASVTAVAGGGLARVSVWLSDDSNGSFSPTSVGTDSTGTAVSLFTAPNVTSVTDDVVTARVTLFGYAGSATGSIEVEPAQQVMISAGPTTRSVLEGTTLNVTYLATDLSGAPAPGVLLLFSVSGGDVVLVPYTTTDPTGRAWALLAFPASIETVVVTVQAATPGYWGHLSIIVTTTAPPPSTWQRLSVYLIVGIGVASVALVAFFAERGRRRRQRPIPKLGLPLPPPADVSPLSRRRP